MKVGYIRVSSDKQDSQRQRDSLSSLGLAKLYTDEDGKNSRDTPEKRKAFQQLLTDVRRGLVSEIYVDRQDRFGARDSYQFGEFITILRDNNCHLYDSSGKCLSSDDDVSILTNALGSITSRREQQEKAHRNVSGKIPSAKAGLYQGGYTPYGLDVVCFRNGVEVWRVIYVGHFKRLKRYPDGTQERYDDNEELKVKGNFPATDINDELRLRPNALRAKTVQSVFEWYVNEGLSPGKIADRLRSLGIDPCFGDWYKQRVSAILTNPVYIGKPTWNKRAASRFSEYIDGKIQVVTVKKTGRIRATVDHVQPDQAQFEPIVSPELFAKAQERLLARKTGKAKTATSGALWLRPFLKCGVCGASMHGSINNARNRIIPSYFCSTYNKLGKGACKCHRTPHAVLERLVMSYLEELPVKIDALLAKPSEVEIDLSEEAGEFQGIACDMIVFRALHGEDGTYEEIFERVLPEIVAKRDTLQAEFDKLMASYADLPKALRLRMNPKLEALLAEIESLDAQAVDLRQPFEDAHARLTERREAAETVLARIETEADCRAKTEALRGIIESITLRHRYDARGKAYLEAIEILPVSGEAKTLSLLETSPGLS